MSFAIYRQHPRFPVTLHAEILAEDHTWQPCGASNISKGGLLVRLEQRRPLYSTVTTRFFLGEHLAGFEFRADVRSCRNRNGGYEMGLKFIQADPAELLRLEKILASEFERREARRYAMRTRVEARRTIKVEDASIGAEFFDLFGRDVSLKGMRLLSEKQLAPGEHVEVNMKFRLGHQLMQADSVVRWCREDHMLRRYEIGVEFTNLDRASSDFLASLVTYAQR